MRIGEWRTRRSGAEVECSAAVAFEDSPRPPATLVIAAEGLDAEPFPTGFFLLAAAGAALAGGEARIAVDGDVDGLLAGNVPVALAHLAAWFHAGRPAPAIEVRGRRTAPAPAPRGCAAILSPGVDDLALFLDNAASYPPGHPLRIDRGFVVAGPDAVPRVPGALRAVAASRGVELVPVRASLALATAAAAEPADTAAGPALAGVLGAFPSRVRNGFVAGRHAAADVVPSATHPLVLPWCGGRATRIHAGLPHRSGLERVRLVAGDPTALAALRVCPGSPPEGGPSGCGRCPECVLTGLALLAAGAPDAAAAVGGGDLAAALVARALAGAPPASRPHRRELVAPLRNTGRPDLAEAVGAGLREDDAGGPGAEARGGGRGLLRRLRDAVRGGAR